MAMTAASMAAKVKAAVDAVGAHQSSDPAGQDAYRLQVYTAMCQGIIEEITQNGHAVGTDSRGDSHTLNLE